MKIEKTKREFEGAVERAMFGLPSTGDLSAPVAKSLAALLDLEFREEPELPKRVRMHLTKGLATAASEDLANRASTVYRDLTVEEYAEAAARYNAIEGLFRGALIPIPPSVLPILRKLIAEERERLQ